MAIDVTEMVKMPCTGMRKFAGDCSGMHSAEPWRTTGGVSDSSGLYLVGIIWKVRNEEMEKRIIKFRGKSVESGEWVYGSLLYSSGVLNPETCEIVRFGGAVPWEIIKVFANSVHQ